jgi:hypothetical protein
VTPPQGMVKQKLRKNSGRRMDGEEIISLILVFSSAVLNSYVEKNTNSSRGNEIASNSLLPLIINSNFNAF